MLYFFVHSSAKNSLKSVKNVVFFLFCILVDKPMGGGATIATLVECLDEIILFFTTEKVLEKYKQLSDGQWILKLMFFTDLCLHVNELHSGLQGRNKTIITMFDLIKTFAAKLQVFNRDVASRTFKYFKNTKEYFLQLESNDHPEQEVFFVVIQELVDEFASRLTLFREFASLNQHSLFCIQTQHY